MFGGFPQISIPFRQLTVRAAVWYNPFLRMMESFRHVASILRMKSWLLALAAVFAAGTVSAKTTKGVWWWHGDEVAQRDVTARRLNFLEAQGVGEIYFCVDLKKFHKETRAFVKAAGVKGMRVALLAGDVSWIRPGSRGFAETLIAYRSYQRHAAPKERFYALHLDVEPFQDKKLPDERKWQLYADFVLRAAADVHAAGEKIEWDIPFWLDTFRVAYGERADAPLLDVVMDNSDGVALMSYRDTAEAMLAISEKEIDMAKTRNVRIVLGAETADTGEGSAVTYFEEGVGKMDAELAKVSAALDAAKVPAGAGIAIHHLDSWEKLFKEEGKNE